ncbi:MAG TPA: phosphate ABC transporter permease PstA [Planctomycetota bacterium]|nr:phosphate ABC transporter permease PstA [Planctomycetota bacterium]
MPLTAFGEPLVWLTGGALALCLLMIVGLLVLVFWQGFTTFWPAPVVRTVLRDGRVLMGEVTRDETYRPRPDEVDELPEAARAPARAALAENDGVDRRRLVRTGNFEISGEHFHWIPDHRIDREDRPEDAVVFERLTWGRFYGIPEALLEDGKPVADGPAAAWAAFESRHGAIRARWKERRGLETHGIGRVNRRLEAARLEVSRAAIDHGKDSAERGAAEAEFTRVREEASRETRTLEAEIQRLRSENARHALRVRTADGQTKVLAAEEIVRAYRPNALSAAERTGVYLSRWGEFLADDPREANSEGGVWPAIFGTVVMTLVMSVAVVPFGVLAALYLREYARAGAIVSAVRIAVNNLAGVPSIVFGVFGLGFFCYIVGGGIDHVLFPEKGDSPTYGKGGVLWSSLTLALLTLPVVIVATEEALSAVPGSMREGSYACGASKWQTIRRIVLPRAMPGIMTGMILAMARGAGEVAPLMLVGAVKLAPDLPMDGVWPFVHPERSFMHLGFHVYDLGFQSQNSEAAKPMVFTTTLLLIGVITFLNLAAVWIRTRLRRKFVANQF